MAAKKQESTARQLGSSGLATSATCAVKFGLQVTRRRTSGASEFAPLIFKNLAPPSRFNTKLNISVLNLPRQRKLT